MAGVHPLAGIDVFIHSVKSGSFTAAAAEMGITKSAVSKSVAQLEARLGITLLHRTTRRLTMTPEGEAFFAQAEAALEQLRAAEDAARSKATAVRGVLRIDMPAAFGRKVAMPILLDILKLHPGLRLAASFTDRVIAPLEEGVDLCLRFGDLPDRTDLAARSLGSQRLVLCASPDYLAAAGTPAGIEDLQRFACILGSRPGRPASWRFAASDGRGQTVAPPETHLLSDGQAVIEMVLAGFGLCQMPHSLVAPYLERKQLVAVLPQFCQVQTPLNLVWPRTRNMLPRVRVVVDEMVRRAAAGQL